nr:beta-1,4-galactosyltransferase 3-like [Manis javanica]
MPGHGWERILCGGRKGCARCPALGKEPAARSVARGINAVFCFLYSLPYKEFFGGVSGLTVEQFRKINGFPNAFWGWGGEDDDLWNRVHYAGFNVTRPEGDLGKYKSIPHHHRGEVQFLGRFKVIHTWTSSIRGCGTPGSLHSAFQPEKEGRINWPVHRKGPAVYTALPWRHVGFTVEMVIYVFAKTRA